MAWEKKLNKQQASENANEDYAKHVGQNSENQECYWTNSIKSTTLGSHSREKEKNQESLN